MSEKNIIRVDDRSFEAEVLAAVGPVLVDFSATWCGPCKRLDPIVHALAAEREGSLRVAIVDLDDAPNVSARFGVRAAPTLMLFEGGEVKRKHVGLLGRQALAELVDGST